MAKTHQAKPEEATERPAFMDKPTGPTLEQRVEAIETALASYSGRDIANALAVIVDRDKAIGEARADADTRNDGGATA